MKKRLFASLLCLALCLGLLPDTALADASVVVNPSEGGNAVVIIPSDDGTATVVIEEPKPPAIGETVEFAEHEWYVIGTETEGVKAPSGCCTLFAKNNDFGSTTYRTDINNADSAVSSYKASDLQKKMEEIANTFSDKDKANIVPRETLDNIWGEEVEDQLLWPISWYGEAENNIDISLRVFETSYWTRNGFANKQSDSAIEIDPDTGEVIEKPIVYTYSVIMMEASGDVQASVNAGTLATAEYPANTHAIRPALYVKAEAVEDKADEVPLVGGKVYFGGQEWYIVGMGGAGPVAGPTTTVTLLASTATKTSTTAAKYSESALRTVMESLADSLNGNLSEREKKLILSRTLTTADEITGDSVTAALWPLSKSEYEGIQGENASVLNLNSSVSYYWLRTQDDTKTPYDYVYAVSNTGSLASVSGVANTYYNARPAFYLDLSDLFFAAGYHSMNASVGSVPKKLESPVAVLNRWNFVLFDDSMGLSMTAVKDQSGQGLTFHYNYTNTGNEAKANCLAYVVEKASQPGVPLYYGKAANLEGMTSGSGTVTVPLLGSGTPLGSGDYTLRFFTEDWSGGNDVLFASDTVDLTIHVENGAVSISDLGDVTEASVITSVTITPSNPTLDAGQQQQFTAAVTSSGSAWYDSTVTWAVTGANSSGTAISDTGLLTVAYDETATSLTVTATSKQDSSKSSSATVTVKAHTHTGTLVPGQEATCTQAGTKAYYTCVCGKYFEDEACTKTITDLETWKVIPALPHQGGLVSGTPATCTAEGVKDYYECSACHQYFEDADCTTPIEDLDAWKVIPALGHNWSGTYLAENADTEKHYHVCTVCGEKDAGEAHTWNYDAATEAHDKHCTTCGYVAEPIVEHGVIQ